MKKFIVKEENGSECEYISLLGADPVFEMMERLTRKERE